MSESEMKGVWIALQELQKRIEKLEGYMEMEDRVTASSVLLRLNQLEECADRHGVNFTHLDQTIQTDLANMTKLQKSVNNFIKHALEKFGYLEKMEMNNRENIFANRNNPEAFADRDSRIENGQTPHMCPICHGSGVIFIHLHPMANIGSGSKYKMDALGRCYMDCETCEGKKIIWG